jgi:hypothetical protein
MRSAIELNERARLPTSSPRRVAGTRAARSPWPKRSAVFDIVFSDEAMPTATKE